MDTVSNALSKIKNASMAGKKEVQLKKSNQVSSIAKILKEEGFIDGYSENGNVIDVTLGFIGKEPKITHFEKVSNPGQRSYISVNNLRPVLNGRGIGIVSTSKGIMTVERAKVENIGGEYICKIW
ncbi:MAG: 30S ribosomal protein S8 [bacterium]